MKKILLLFIFLNFALAQEYLIKVATIAPDGSTWINVLREYDAQIRKESNGRIGFKIYAGGVAGDEIDVLKKIRIGQYHAGGFTGVGIGEIAPNVRVLDSPFLFKNYDEVDHIYQKFSDELEKEIEKGGFVLLGWAEVGFVYTFTKTPVYGIEDLKKIKMWAWQGDPIAEVAYKVESIVAKLLEQDRELRLAVDLKPIDDDIKKVAVGGVEEKYEFNLSDEEAGKLLAESFAKIDKLERELRLQQKSYEEIYRQYRINQEKFKRIPAILPLKGSLTSKFGYRKHPILGIWAMHEGVDLVVDVGTPVYATGDGVVSYVGYRGRYGLLVEIDHGFGYVTLYAHLSKAFVREGQKVKRGDRIALSGATGLVTAPHLH